jgi:2-iminobutanoate/2-iminopropanoate deaminase
VYTAGVMPLDAESLSVPRGGIGAQTHQTMRNLRGLPAGSSLDRLVQVTIHLKDCADFAEMNAAYITYLKSHLILSLCVPKTQIRQYW